MADNMIERARQTAAKHHLGEHGSVNILRCVAALGIFPKGHPEREEVEAMLIGNTTLLDAVVEFMKEPNPA